MPSISKFGKSFRKSKRKPPGSISTSDAGLGQSADAFDSPTSNASEPASPIVTPPQSPQERNDQAENRQGTSAIMVPSSPGSPGRSASSSKKSLGGLRPLRLGSFNFDNPDANTNGSSSSSPQQTKTLTFPPLFHEADDMLILSNLIYTLAELRDLARNGVLNSPATSMRIIDAGPLPLDTALKIIVQEGELLKEVLDDGKHEATLSSLESLLDRQKEKIRTRKAQKAQAVSSAAEATAEGTRERSDSGMFGWMTGWDGCLAGGFSFDELFCGDLAHVSGENGNNGAEAGAKPKQQQEEMDSSMICAVGDLKSNEELVYAVGVNAAEERITVVFRGSVTKNDFMTDAKIAIVPCPDPRSFNGTQGDDFNGGNVGVHQGFYDYLFGPSSSANPNKYEEIMRCVEQVRKENPSRRNYKLYITGHSLGGALATLFGFYASASSSLPLPVTVVSVASPRVGNVQFARTFAEMESQGKLRHLRIANHKDPVTLGPTVSSKRGLALSAKAFSPLGYLALMVTGNGEGGDEEVYYHTGMKMKLFKNVSAIGSQRCELKYSGATIVSGAKKPVAIDKEDLAEIEQSNRRKKKDSSAELPMVSYHYGTSYSERLAAVESDLQGMTLNNLYRDKAGGMPWVV